MKNKMIYILTGPVQSGKTTTLLKWLEKRKDVFGILTPIQNGKRVFMNAATKEQFQMEAEVNEENVFSVGKYIFSKKAFEKANSILEDAIKEREGWIIVDEIGPLELKGEGFHEMVKEVLSSKSGLSILFVVRQVILDEVMQHYRVDITGVTIVDMNSDFFQQ